MTDSNSIVIDEHISSTYKSVSNIASQHHIRPRPSGKSWKTLYNPALEKMSVVIIFGYVCTHDNYVNLPVIV